MKHEHETNQVNETQTPHYTYMDCLRGITPVPRTPNGATIFRVLMVGGMVTFMVTVNSIRHTGFEFLMQSHWLYPLMFCIAFLVRTYIGDTLVGFLAPRTVLKWFAGPTRGVTRGIAMTVLNVLIMAPIMCAIATLLLNGLNNYFISYITTLPIVMPIAAVVNFFIVGPIVKLLFNNKISPAGGLGFLDTMRANTDSLTRLLGF